MVLHVYFAGLLFSFRVTVELDSQRSQRSLVMSCSKCLFCPVITALLRSGQSFGSVFVLSALCQRAMAAAGCGLGQRVSLPLPKLLWEKRSRTMRLKKKSCMKQREILRCGSYFRPGNEV